MPALRSFRLLAVAVLLPLLAGASASTASAATSKVNVTIGPLTAPAGAAAVSASAVLANPAGADRIGSANLQPPTGFSVTSATLVGRGRATISGGTVQLRDLALTANSSISVTMALAVPCDTGQSTNWATPVKTSRDFSGADLGISTISSTVTDVRGTCTMDWRPGPASAKVTANVTSVRYDPGSPPARVTVLDADGVRIASATGAVRLGFASSADDDRALSSTQWSLSATDGYATFAGLKISAAGTYALRATVTSGRLVGVAPATSATFRVDDKVEPCAAGSACPPGRLTSGAASFAVDAVAGASRAYLTLSAGAELELTELDCDPKWIPFTGATALFSVASDDPNEQQRSKVISTTVSKQAMNAFAENGAPRLEICFASPEPFTAKLVDGTAIAATKWTGRFDWDADGDNDDVYTGLLPDCPKTGQACITQRKKTGAGQGYIEGSVPASLVDPAMRT